VEPFAEEDDFARDGGDVIPGEQAEESEVEFGEGVQARYAAEAEGDFAGAEHAWIGARDAGEFEGEVGLDGRVDLGRAAVVDVPAAVLELERADVIDGFALPEEIDFTVPVVVGESIGDESAIDDEFAEPVAIGFLEAKQVILRSFDGGTESGRIDLAGVGVLTRRSLTLGMCDPFSHEANNVNG
jgi:hypothetical protein